MGTGDDMRMALIMITVILVIFLTVLVVLRTHEFLPSDMQPAQRVRDAVKGKTVADVSKIVFEGIPWFNTPTVVTNTENISAFLKGMQVAVRPKNDIGAYGPSITIFWKDGAKSGPFYFYVDEGPKWCYGRTFAMAYNRIAEPDRKIDMSKP